MAGEGWRGAVDSTLATAAAGVLGRAAAAGGGGGGGESRVEEGRGGHVGYEGGRGVAHAERSFV